MAIEACDERPHSFFLLLLECSLWAPRCHAMRHPSHMQKSHVGLCGAVPAEPSL